MQVTETVSDGLKREFKVVVPAAELANKADAKLSQLKDQVRINGFRPGKVPVAHLKRLYGRSVMAEMIEATVREANAQIVTERGFKLVREPQVTLPTEQGAVEQIIDGKSDLAYTVSVEILPPIELADFKGIQLERLNAEITEPEVDEALARIAEQSRPSLRVDSPDDLLKRLVIQSMDGLAEPNGSVWSRATSRLERALIEEALVRCEGIKLKAADFLGINRNTLNKKFHELGLDGAAPEAASVTDDET